MVAPDKLIYESMITFFTTLRPFGISEVFDRIQANAVCSWQALPCPVQVIILGREAGVDAFAAMIGADHLPDIEYSDLGRPLVRSALQIAEHCARYPLRCLINGDNILTGGWAPLFYYLHNEISHFMVLSRRRNIPWDKPIDFNDCDWDSRLRWFNLRHGQWHTTLGKELFIYDGSLMPMDAEFMLATPACDDFIVHHARGQGRRLLDATAIAAPLHQDHEYLREGRMVDRAIAFHDAAADFNRALWRHYVPEGGGLAIDTIHETIKRGWLDFRIQPRRGHSSGH